MAFNDPRTEIGLLLYSTANLARTGGLRVLHIKELREQCADALPDDAQLLEAVDEFSASAFEQPQTAASGLVEFMQSWWRHHFPEDYAHEKPLPHDWQLRADTGMG